MKIRTGILIGILFCVNTLPAQSPYKVFVDTMEMLIGDQNVLHLEVSSATGIQFPDFTTFFDSLEAFELVRLGPTLKSTEEGGYAISKEVYFTVFDTGYFWLPSFQLWSEGSDSVLLYKSNPIPLLVSGVPTDSLGLAPIKPILREPRNLQDYLPLIILVIALVIGVLLYVFRDRFKKKKKPEPIIEQVVPPFEKAMQQIEQLEADKLWQQGHLKAYYSRISLILREYLENEFEMPALESTTAEITQQCNKRGLLSGAIDNLSFLLMGADMVKYAKRSPDLSHHVASMDSLKEIIRSLYRTRRDHENGEEE